MLNLALSEIATITGPSTMPDMPNVATPPRIAKNATSVCRRMRRPTSSG